MNDIAGFQLWLAQKGRKVGTVRNASYCITRVLRRCELSKDSIASYLFQLQREGKRNAYINHFVTAIHLYGEYTSTPWMKDFHQLPPQAFLKATMSDDEIEAFLSVPCVQAQYLRGTTTLSPSWIRWEKMTVFWSICAFSGMRTGEVAHLTVNAVDWGRNVFILEDTKTNEPRVVPIASNIKERLQAYIAQIDTDLLFPSPRGGIQKGVCLDNVDWGYDFHLRMKRLGIKRKNLSPYSLRHSLITRLLEEDVNLFKVQKIVGHRRIETTARYTHLTTKDMQESIKKHPLIRRSTDPKAILKAVSDTIKGFQLENDPRFTYTVKETEQSIEIKITVVSSEVSR